jgi:hypothetical protein
MGNNKSALKNNFLNSQKKFRDLEIVKTRCFLRIFTHLNQANCKILLFKKITVKNVTVFSIFSERFIC